MPTATDRAKTDSTHRKVIKNNKIERKKILQEENDKIDRILRSPALTDADKERNFQQRERNLTEIIKLSDEIKIIDNDLMSPSGSYPVKRGRSQTRGPNRRCASPSPIQRSPRSASSSLSRKRSDQEDEDKLRKMQDQLEQSMKETEPLRRELYAESSRYGDDIYHFNSKKKDMDSEVSYRLRLQNADLSTEHQNILKENKDLRDMNYKLNLDSEILSRGIKELETEKEFLATMLQDRNSKITKYKLAVVELEYDNDLIRDEKDRLTIEKKSFYDQIRELSRSLSEERQKVRETATKPREKYQEAILDLEQKITSLTEEVKEKEAALTKLVKVDIPHLRQERDDYKESAAKNKQKLCQEMKLQLEEIQKRSCQQISEYEEMLQEYKVENEKLRNENTETMKQLQSLQNFFTKRKDYYNNIAGKTEDNNASLRGRLKIEIEERAGLQRENKTLNTQIDSSVRENDVSSKTNLEELGNLQNRIDELKTNLELMQKAYQRECRLRDIEEHERGSQHLKEENDKELNRLRQLEINYKCEADVLRSDKNDLEKKVQHLHKEKERLRRNGETERKAAEELRRVLYAEKRNSDERRDRMKELESYKKKEESLVENVNRLRKENDGLVQNGNREREEAEKLKRELDATKTDLKKLQDRIRDLERKGATSVDKKDEPDSLTLTLSEAVKEFQGIFKKEWKEAARALSNNRVFESQIWQKLYEILKICLCGTNTECTDMTKCLKRFRYFKSDHNLQKETVMKMACVATAVPTKTKEILEMISTGNHHVPNSAPDAVKTSPSKDEEHEKYSDIEGSVIRIVDNQDTESGNPSASVGTSPFGMACSVTNYDLTSDFSKSCSIKAQKE